MQTYDTKSILHTQQYSVFLYAKFLNNGRAFTSVAAARTILMASHQINIRSK